MNVQSDQQLLRDYVRNRREQAFAELVRRHVDLVYSAALRRVQDPHHAQDVTQGTFAALAQSANQLVHHPVLSGWLHRTTQNIAANLIRSNARRQAREQEAVTMNRLLSSPPDADWRDIARHLDAALDELDATDRDAVMLRYFEKKSAREMAAQLGISDEAAQKRVNRAVGRLRDLFVKRGVTVGAGGLVGAIAASAVQAAPAGLAVAASAAALAGQTVSTATIVATSTKTLAMTTLQKTLVTAALAALAGAGIYEAARNSQLHDQIQALRRKHAPLTEQLQQLQEERDDATNRLADLLAENTRLKSNSNQAELLRLRGEVGVLRRIQREAASRPANSSAEEQSSSDLFHCTMEELTNAGRATPLSAVQTLFWAGFNNNSDEMRKTLIADTLNPPTVEAVKHFIEANTGTPSDPNLLSNAVCRIVSQKEISPDEFQMGIALDLKSEGMSIHKSLTMRNVGSEWKVVIYRASTNSPTKLSADLTNPESARGP